MSNRTGSRARGSESVIESVASDYYDNYMDARFDKFESELTSVKNYLAAVRTDVSGLRQDVSALQQDVSVIEQRLSSVEQDVAGIKLDVAFLKQDVASLNLHVTTLEQDLAVVKADVAELKAELAALKAEFGARMNGFEISFVELKMDMKSVKDNYATKADLSKLEEKVMSLAVEVQKSSADFHKALHETSWRLIRFFTAVSTASFGGIYFIARYVH